MDNIIKYITTLMVIISFINFLWNIMFRLLFKKFLWRFSIIKFFLGLPPNIKEEQTLYLHSSYIYPNDYKVEELRGTRSVKEVVFKFTQNSYDSIFLKIKTDEMTSETKNEKLLKLRNNNWQLSYDFSIKNQSVNTTESNKPHSGVGKIEIDKKGNVVDGFYYHSNGNKGDIKTIK